MKLSQKMKQLGMKQTQAIREDAINQLKSGKLFTGFYHTQSLNRMCDNDVIQKAHIKTILKTLYYHGVIQFVFDEKGYSKGYQLTTDYQDILGLSLTVMTKDYHYVLFNPVGQHVIQTVDHWVGLSKPSS